MSQPFLIKQLKLAAACLSAYALLACEPYEKCDESLKVGDELTFRLTEGPSVEEQIDDCGAPLPFDVDSVFQLTVEKFVGGYKCDSTTGPVRLDGSDLVWLDAYDDKANSKFRGNYQLNRPDDCTFFMRLQFIENTLFYRVSGSSDQTNCPFQACVGSFKGE